jgi:hypothetical protein
LALTARILLLLAGLWGTALLLTGLLAQALVVLTRILVRIGHSGTSLLGIHLVTTDPGRIGSPEFQCDQSAATT